MQQDAGNASYTKRVWIKAGIYAFMIVILLLLKATFSVLLLVLAGALIAIYFTSLANLICRKTGWKEGVCKWISVLGSVSLLAGILWLVGADVQKQVNELSDSIPSLVNNAEQKIKQYPLGNKLISKLSSDSTMEKAQHTVKSFFQSTFGIFGDLYVMIFIAIFFTVESELYKKGLIKLVPKQSQEKATSLLVSISDNLRKWLKGKLFAMLVVFILTAIALVLLGIPMWLALALIAGLFNFIPNFGPIIALAPALLVSLTKGGTIALVVLVIYVFIQVLESNFITPTVQKKLVHIPPALIIIAQLLVAPLTSVWGLVLATPLMLIIMTSVQKLYLNRVNEDDKR